ncbi:S8 family serine peptidase [Saccharothrix carnea]|uniref:S8 family serine peptidase n=1 Tax=Saccharothrix carnea TaxID=1280637 RepID=UPI0011B28AB8|nr:S8 family serine peptidase [Saccharothrix carnea]
MLVAVVSLSLLGLPPGQAAADPEPERFPGPPRPDKAAVDVSDPNAVLVRFADAVPAEARERALTSRGASHAGAVRGTGYVKVKAKGNARDLLRELRQDPAVAEVSFDHERRVTTTPGDPFFATHQLSYSDTVRLGQAWDVSKGSTDQVIAVLDTGVNGLHDDLRGVTVTGYNALTGTEIAAGADSDDNGHGTMAAGIAAANTDNGIGVAGAAWTARVMPVKVLGAGGRGVDSDIAEGLAWAADHGAEVVNLSLGGPVDSPVLHDAVRYAVDRGVVVVAAAGNSGGGVPLYPAAYPEVLAVGATDWNGDLTDFSSWGEHIDVAAPGLDITSLDDAAPDRTRIGSGTSFAAPIAAGVAALVRAVNPSWTPRQVVDRIRAAARDAGPRGIDPYYGHGVLDAFAAVGGPRAAAFPPRVLGANEPNDVPARATTFATSVTGTLEAEGDVDWYRFDPAGRQSLAVTVTPPAFDANRARNTDLVVAAYDQDLRLIAEVDETGPGQAEVLEFVAGTGFHYLTVRNYHGAVDARAHTVSVAAAPPSLFQPGVGFDVDAEARMAQVADVTGDGRADAIIATTGPYGAENADKLFVFAQQPDGTLAPPVRYATDAVPKGFFAVLDTNGDDRLDIAVNAVGGIAILRQTAAGTLENAGLIPGGGGIPVTADMDGDGDGDLVAASERGINLLTQGEGGTFTETVVTTEPFAEPEVGDVDGDGRPDIVVAPPYHFGNAPISVFHPTGSGWAKTTHRTGMTSPESVRGIEVADVSGDGRADVITTFGGNKPSSHVSVLTQNATGGLDTAVVHPVLDLPDAVEAADVNGDSRLDVVVLHGWHTVGVLPQDSDGGLGAPEYAEIDVPTGSNHAPQALALGDIDGNARPDAIFADYLSGLVVLRNNNGPTRAGPAVWVRDSAPADFATNVASTAVPAVTFQRDVDPRSVSASTVRLLDGRTGAPVDASVSYDAATRTARVTPTAALEADSTPYRLVVDGVRDTTGSLQAQRFTSTFSTADGTPGPVTGLTATGGVREAKLSWTLPPIHDLAQVVVRQATGPTPPSSITSGTGVYEGTGHEVTAPNLTAGTTYSFAVWVRDQSGKLSTPTTATLTGSSFTGTANAKSVNPGGSVTLSGRVTRPDTGAPITGVPVELHHRRTGSGTWTPAGTATTNGNGEVSLTHRPPSTTEYRWVHPGSTTFIGCDSPPTTVRVR